jgi:ubiquinone/menaquinone biosynthesis C-methylase UbiE
VKKFYKTPCINLGSGHGEVEKNFKVDLSVDLFDDYAKRYNKFLKWDLDKEITPLGDATYELAMCFGTIHYLQNPRVLINEVNRILKPNGRFLLNITMEKAGISNLWAVVNKVDMQHSGLVPKNLEKMLEESGFDIESKKALGLKTYYLCTKR